MSCKLFISCYVTATFLSIIFNDRMDYKNLLKLIIMNENLFDCYNLKVACIQAIIHKRR